MKLKLLILLMLIPLASASDEGFGFGEVVIVTLTQADNFSNSSNVTVYSEVKILQEIKTSDKINNSLIHEDVSIENITEGNITAVTVVPTDKDDGIYWPGFLFTFFVIVVGLSLTAYFVYRRYWPSYDYGADLTTEEESIPISNEMKTKLEQYIDPNWEPDEFWRRIITLIEQDARKNTKNH